MILIQTTRETAAFRLEDLELFKAKVIEWSVRFEVCCYLDNNGHNQDRYQTYDALIGVGAEAQLFKSNQPSFDTLKSFYEEHKDWLFGFLTYDLKNEVEKLSSANQDGLSLPEMHFFQPNTVFEIGSGEVLIHSAGCSPFTIFQEIQNIEINLAVSALDIPTVHSRFSKSEYIKTVKRIKDHIIEGDLYEMNFCQEFYAEDLHINPIEVFKALNKISKAPFAAFYKLKDKYLLCASPERYLKKKGETLISQPIKGTTRRGSNPAEDLALKRQLYSSEKDRAENVMIVDLVRNDLARVCESGTVEVEELFGIYGFEQVFQMISTVKGTLKKHTHLIDAIKKTFPMGSMTGAPKVMAMELIEQYEKSKRGLYSGAVGYITPGGDFDFNVVIRSMLYNKCAKYLSFQVGGAIVYDSVAEEEYEECLLKAKAILQVLRGDV